MTGMPVAPAITTGLARNGAIRAVLGAQVPVEGANEGGADRLGHDTSGSYASYEVSSGARSAEAVPNETATAFLLVVAGSGPGRT
jgi:hypothetical protein